MSGEYPAKPAEGAGKLSPVGPAKPASRGGMSGKYAAKPKEGAS